MSIENMMQFKQENRPQPGTSRLLRSQEAALYIGQSQKRLRELVRLQQIKAVQEGNRPWTFDKQELDRWLDEYIQRHTTTTPLPSGVNGYSRKRKREDYGAKRSSKKAS